MILQNSGDLVNSKVVSTISPLASNHMHEGYLRLLYLLLFGPVSLALQFSFSKPPMAVQSTKLDPINYPQAPRNLTLEQVHVYVRHGE